MLVFLLEPFYGGSHGRWCDELMSRSGHHWRLFSRPARHWKWRMHGAAISLAREVEAAHPRPDLLVASDMLDVASFLGLTRRRLGDVPLLLYFHENQLSYPWSPNDPDPGAGRDRHYGFVNYRSALAADGVLFNSRYHHDSFFAGARELLQRMPDDRELARVEELESRSEVLPLGLDLRRFDELRRTVERRWQRPRILWNHRWEYDKDPETFADVVIDLDARGHDFDLVLLGARYEKKPAALARIREAIPRRLLHDGHLESAEAYGRWLCSCDLLPVTSRQDFFGISIAEAAYCGARPLLPRRLAYPELYDAQHHPERFYQDVADLRGRLEAALSDWRGPRPADELAAELARFDWETMAPRYDERLVSWCERVRTPSP